MGVSVGQGQTDFSELCKLLVFAMIKIIFPMWKTAGCVQNTVSLCYIMERQAGLSHDLLKIFYIDMCTYNVCVQTTVAFTLP